MTTLLKRRLELDKSTAIAITNDVFSSVIMIKLNKLFSLGSSGNTSALFSRVCSGKGATHNMAVTTPSTVSTDLFWRTYKSEP